MFQELEAAHRKQDLARVRELWQALQSGDWTADAATVTDSETLQRRLATLRARIRDVQDEIKTIHADETWRRIATLVAEGTAWNEYFAKTRADLEVKLDTMKQETPTE